MQLAAQIREAPIRRRPCHLRRQFLHRNVEARLRFDETRLPTVCGDMAWERRRVPQGGVTPVADTEAGAGQDAIVSHDTPADLQERMKPAPIFPGESDDAHALLFRSGEQGEATPVVEREGASIGKHRLDGPREGRGRDVRAGMFCLEVDHGVPRQPMAAMTAADGATQPKIPPCALIISRAMRLNSGK